MDIIQGQTEGEDNANVKQPGKLDPNQPKKRRCVCTEYTITRSRSPVDLDQTGIPPEILRMDSQSIEVYKKALEDGREKDYSVRLMVVGPYGVGKTAFTNQLLEEQFVSKRESTEGIDIHVRRCRISLKTSKWIIEHDSKAAQDFTTRRLARVLESSRTGLNGSQVNIEETFEKEFADELRTHDDSSSEKSELPETPVVEQESEMLKPPIDKEDDESSSVIYERVPVKEDDESSTEINNRVPKVGSAQVEEDNTLLRQIKEVIDAERPGSDDDHASVSVWDFGGQFVFYTTHQMFLAHRAIYILVINMSQPIDDIMDDKPYFDCCETKNLKIEDFLDIWLYSIHGQSKTDGEGTPRIILVGTHTDLLDPVNRDEKVEKIFEAIRNRFKKNDDIRFHFINKDFGLSNSERDPDILEDLRQTILDVAKDQSYWGEIKPAKWIPFEKVLDELRSKGVQIISRGELEELNQQLPVPITNVEELDLFLRFQHEVGSIMYFSVPEELKDKIVLSPQFLVNALKSLITAEMFCKKDPRIKWDEFKDKGILTTNLLDAVWKKEENKTFQENREHILALMEHLNIIAKPVKNDEEKESGEDVETEKCIYLVPCMLKKPPPPTVLLHKDKDYISTPCLCLALENVAFPSAIFNRLLVGCISHWALAIAGTKTHIYCGCGQFDVNKQHRLTLSFSDNVIFISITRYGKEHRHPDVSICHKAHSTVKQILERIEKILSIVLKINEHIQCPLRRTVFGPCMYSVETLEKESVEFPCHRHSETDPLMLDPRDLLKYWFDSEETDYNISSDVRIQPSVLPPAMAGQIPTEKEIATISKGIGSEYELLALQLGIADAKIQQIKMENPESISYRITRLLLEWKQQCGQQATYSELEKAMKAVPMNTQTVFRGILK